MFINILKDKNMYVEFMMNVVEPIVTYNRMMKMKSEGNSYIKIVSKSDEVFGLLILEDRLRLWMEISKRRVIRDDGCDDLESKMVDKDGKSIEDHLRDDYGQAYTKYSNGGIMCPEVLKG